MIANVHSFESFGTVDGPGVRFVIFMQGCPMRCAYCHNPDTWEIGKGHSYSVEEILSEVQKYKNYIFKDGGVTLSGGEPLLQMDFVLSLFKELKKLGYHTCIDTSGIIFDESNEKVRKQFDELLKVCDLFLLDIKHIDNQEHLKLTKQSNNNILKFATYLSDHQKGMWIRHVLVPGITSNPVYLSELRAFLDTLKTIEKIEVLPYHTMGISKYEKLGIDYPLKKTKQPSEAEMKLAKSILKVKD
ncbi:MAG: pyruvate formate-lyase-activating protein [Erysipelotrichaceae bacterium]